MHMLLLWPLCILSLALSLLLPPPQQMEKNNLHVQIKCQELHNSRLFWLFYGYILQSLYGDLASCFHSAASHILAVSLTQSHSDFIVDVPIHRQQTLTLAIDSDDAWHVSVYVTNASELDMTLPGYVRLSISLRGVNVSVLWQTDSAK